MPIHTTPNSSQLLNSIYINTNHPIPNKLNIQLPNLTMTWIRGRTIGRGSSATVSLATDSLSGEVFAVKSADLSGSEFLRREKAILSTLDCPQIVAYKGCDTTFENGKLVYNLFMEYAPGGALTDVVRGGGRLDEAAIGSYARQLLLGLDYLHSSGIVHCDIKGQNILVAEDGVKIADLGCAKWASDADAPISGTPLFMAPEVARGEQQGFAADIWALGCTVIEMATGRAPWPDVSNPVSALYRVGYSGEVPEIPSFMSEQGRDFLGKCLMKAPGERWSAKELLKHAFVETNNFVFKEISGFISNTPRGVLDQGLWDSNSSESDLIDPTQLLINSPAERIRRLSQGSRVAAPETEESWVTVRSYDKEVEVVALCGNESTKRGCGTETVVAASEEEFGELINGDGDGAMTSCESNVGDIRIRSSRRQKKKAKFVAWKCTQQKITCGNLHFQHSYENFVGFFFHISVHSFKSHTCIMKIFNKLKGAVGHTGCVSGKNVCVRFLLNTPLKSGMSFNCDLPQMRISLGVVKRFKDVNREFVNPLRKPMI